MRKLLGIAVVTAVLSLTGCGGGDDSSADSAKTTSEASPTTEASTPTESEDSGSGSASSEYCDALKGAKTNLAAVDFTQLNEKVYTQLTVEIAKVAKVAPASVKSDWATVLGALNDLHRILGTAGIDFDDLANLQAGQVPPGVTAEKLQALGAKLKKYEKDGALQESSQAIQDSAQQDCDLALN